MTHKFDYEPPKVTWEPITGEVDKTLPTGEIRKESRVIGHRVEPPFGDCWDHLTTLRHFAALIEHRTGLKVRVSPAEKPEADQEPEPEAYDVLTEHSVGGPASFETIWSWLSGFENGVFEVHWQQTSKTEPK